VGIATDQLAPFAGDPDVLFACRHVISRRRNPAEGAFVFELVCDVQFRTAIPAHFDRLIDRKDSLLQVARPFLRNDIRGFDIWGISPLAYIPSSADVPLLNADGSARQQKAIVDGREVFQTVTKTIPVYQLIFPGGDTQGVTNLEYRIPIVGPVVLAGFFDAGLNKVARRSQLSLNPGRLAELNSAFPQASFERNAILANGTQKIRASTGLELQIMMPVVNAPFRLYWAYNPSIYRDFIVPPVVVDRSSFPNNATFNNALFQIGRPSPFYERRSTFRFTISRTF
jgi:outer membrane protein insertion porin family